MHIIKIRESHIIEAFDGPTAEITVDLIEQMYAPVRENKRRLFEDSLTIEHTLQQIVTFYFFGYDEVNKARAKAFNNLVMNSDWCSFSAKRRLVIQIIQESGALKGQEKADYEKALSDLMAARNAFTHGSISTDGRRVKLSFFQGTPKVKFLDDEYLKGIEKTIEVCMTTSDRLCYALGVYRLETPSTASVDSDDPVIPDPQAA